MSVDKIQSALHSYVTVRNSCAASIASLIAWKIVSKCADFIVDTYDRWSDHKNIRVLFNQPYRPGLLKELSDVLDQATTNITFLGFYYITAPGYRGYIGIDSANERIVQLDAERLKNRMDAENFKLVLVQNIFKLYQDGDEILNRMNWFSGTIGALRRCRQKGIFRYKR
jgi:hypothetical protein